MPFAYLAAATIGSSLIGANAAQNAANTQANAAKAGQQQLQQNFQNISPLFNPYVQTGQTGIDLLNTNINNLTQPFTNQSLNQNLAPNYAFQLQQGQGAVNAQNNATGGLIGGNALKGLEDYTQSTAQNAYQNAFNNYQTGQSNIFNRLSSIAGIGQNAVTGLSNLATGNATNISNLGVGAANAQAAGQVGSANAISGGLTGAAQNNFLASLLNPNTYTGAQDMTGFQTPNTPITYPVTNSSGTLGSGTFS
jgi:hypothetical protein